MTRSQRVEAQLRFADKVRIAQIGAAKPEPSVREKIEAALLASYPRQIEEREREAAAKHYAMLEAENV